MKIFDMHIHAFDTEPTPEALLKNMEKAGVYGGCIFSNRPTQCNPTTGTPFDERLKQVLSWTKGYEDRLFPVLWIHPYEENIIEKVNKAVQMGICAFKIICTDFYVYEEKSLEVLAEIARLNKPVFFHSGILWDGMVSSEYNRPINWEALLNIKGLKFSMGHCSWPWIDECIALYGKFLNASVNAQTAEMFFDITPGTPEIYREELMTKLYTIGYDVGGNMMFGTDSHAHKYNVAGWADKWLDIDRRIFDKLGISKACREDLYENNLMRFLGKSDKAVTHSKPVSDNANAWSPLCESVTEIIEKWYNRLSFLKAYDEEFRQALKEIKISDAVSIDSYDVAEKDGKRNLLSYLYMCEALEEKYREKGIAPEILDDTLKDIVGWTDTWSGIKNTLYLGETAWLKNHLSMKLFKLGRLQFCMGKISEDIPSKKLVRGDNVIEIHIPAGGALTNGECMKSIEAAKEFFARYFPEFEYKCFICHSWLLDKTLKEILSAGSNIIKFQDMFDIVSEEKSDAILKYVFQWNTTRASLKSIPCAEGFPKRVKDNILSGTDFFEATGIIEK